MSLESAKRLHARANRRDIAAARLPLDAQGRLRRLAALDRVQVMRELANVIGYVRRDSQPFPPEQLGMTQMMEGEE